jgi:hypothetical protein
VRYVYTDEGYFLLFTRFTGPRQTYIQKVMNAIEIFRRPEPLSGYERITWRSAYGKPLYIDVKETSKGGAKHLQERLRKSATLAERTVTHSSSADSVRGEPQVPAPVHISGNPGTPGDSGDSDDSTQNVPWRQIGPTTANNRSISTASNQQLQERQYLLLCFDTRKSKSFRQINVTDIANDQFLFQRIHDVYWETKSEELWISRLRIAKLLWLPSWIHWCFEGVHFFTPKRADFISVSYDLFLIGSDEGHSR